MSASNTETPSGIDLRGRVHLAALVITAVTFVWLFAQPMRSLARDWWTNPEAGHGLLLAPLAVWLAWRAGVRKDRRPQIVLGVAAIVAGCTMSGRSLWAPRALTARTCATCASARIASSS